MSVDQLIVSPKRRLKMPWGIPFIGLLIALYLTFYNVGSKNLIKISFELGQGIRPGFSKLQLNGIDVGRVKSAYLSPDLTHVIIVIEVPSWTLDLITEGTIFWRDKKSSGVLDIAMMAPSFRGRARREFIGREDPPILTQPTPGRVFLLQARRIGHLGVKSPIIFRDILVGQVLGWDIAPRAEYVTIHAFVKAPYDAYVNKESQFWVSEAVLYDGSPPGRVEVSRSPSIAYDYDDDSASSAELDEDHIFNLYDKEPVRQNTK